MKQDKQPRRASKDVGIDKLHPRSDMNSRAAGGDKESNEALPRRKKSSGVQSTPARKPSR
ncbi:MAG TPA: hypothetical protein VGD76_10120 [Ramlibacter sp.]